MNKQNLHTHTTFCDGKQTPREMVEIAISKGFDSLGFSEHSPTNFAIYCGMTNDRLNEYANEVFKLKKEYEGKFDIFCGVEYDIYSDIDISQFEYSIVSVHYLPINGKFVGIDRSKEDVKQVVDTYFNGDGMKYARFYYDLLKTIPQYGNFDILAHPDILAKHIESIPFFDQDSEEYLEIVKDALKELSGKIEYFEVNTGAISRGYRKNPYPSIPILKILKEYGFKPIVSSDCHDGQYLDCEFDRAFEILKECGFKERYIFTKNGFVAVPL